MTKYFAKNESERKMLLTLDITRSTRTTKSQTIQEMKLAILREVLKCIDKVVESVDDNTGIGMVTENLGYGQTITLVPIFADDGRLACDSSEARKSTLAMTWKISVYKRDKFTCQQCGSKEHIQAHHIQSWKDNPRLRFDISNGVTLCTECHAKEHPKLANLIKGQPNAKKTRKQQKQKNKSQEDSQRRE